MANSPQKPQPLTYFFVDASPLVALAVAERLDILERIGSPFFIADAAAHEIMGMATEPVRQRFRNWANANQNLAKVITTPFGAAYKAAEQMQVEGEVAITRRFAEWLASWVTDNFRALLPQINLQTTRPVGVVLSEDLEMQSGYRIRGAVPSTFHFMSTQAFFRTLKRFHLIAEAQDLWTRVDVSGRPDNSKWRAAARQREREELNSVVDLAAQRARSPKNRSTSGTAQGGGGAPAPRLPDSWKW
jgi:hypothetical protein